MKIDIIAGARPNFMKIAPIISELDKVISNGANITYRLIHTGQHFDKNMSSTFFEQLGIPEPNINLGAGGGTQAEQTSAIMTGYEKLLFQEKSDLCMVVGDVTSTMACSIVAKKMFIKVAHVEGGIRSGDMSMPEEINRILTDSISDYFFTTSKYANKNLSKAGIDRHRIFFVGNTMIDSLLKNKSKFAKPEIWERAKLKEKEYLIITLHRPANVDDPQKMHSLLNEIVNNSNQIPLIFPVHPRTAKVIETINQKLSSTNLYLIEPLGYLEFNYLVKRAKAVITDSGGITEETTVMGVPCMTLRDSTERPETIEIGTNELLGTDPKSIKPAMRRLFLGEWKRGTIPPLWDGKTATRIVGHLLALSAG